MRKLFISAVAMLNIASAYCADVNLSIEKEAGKHNTLVTTEKVTAEKIENTSSPQALELISRMPGVLVQKTGDAGRTDPVIRGIGDSCRKIAVLIDGKPEKMSLFGCGVSHSILAANIERIEVVKGPDSVLYGSGALGGAINIITKQPTKPFEGNINVSAGSFNAQNSGLYIAGIENNITYAVSANKYISDGHLANSQYNASDYYEKLGYSFKDGSILSVEAKQYFGLKHEPAPYAAGYWEDYQRGSVQLNYDKSLSASEISIKVYNNYGDHQFSDGWHSKDSMSGITANYNMDISEKNYLQTGAEFKQQEGRLLAGAPYMAHDGWKISDWSVFALDKHNITEKLSAVAGARFNNDEISGSVFAPRAGVEYGLSEIFSVKALYSKGFRAPYLNELYLVPARNKDLKAEEVNNYEIGFNAKSYDFNFNITGFIMKGDNIIENKGGKLQNTGEYEFKGCELAADYAFNKYLNGGLGYTYFDAGKNTQGRPVNKIDADFTVKMNKFSLNTNAIFLGEYYAADSKQNRLDDFAVLNARLNYDVNDTVRLFLEGQNITNQKYYMFLDRDGGKIMEMPCATFTVGTKVKF